MRYVYSQLITSSPGGAHIDSFEFVISRSCVFGPVCVSIARASGGCGQNVDLCVCPIEYVCVCVCVCVCVYVRT